MLHLLDMNDDLKEDSLEINTFPARPIVIRFIGLLPHYKSL
jgi:hypothetical protein